MAYLILFSTKLFSFGFNYKEVWPSFVCTHNPSTGTLLPDQNKVRRLVVFLFRDLVRVRRSGAFERVDFTTTRSFGWKNSYKSIPHVFLFLFFFLHDLSFPTNMYLSTFVYYNDDETQSRWLWILPNSWLYKNVLWFIA